MNTNNWFSQLIPAMLLLLGASATAQSYRVVDLATLAQGNAAVVRGPNIKGEGVGGGTLAGAGRSAGGQRKGLYLAAGAARHIAGLSNNDDTIVYGQNDTGDIVGSSNSQSALRAFAGKAGTARELLTLSGDTSSVAHGGGTQGQA